MKKKKRKVLKIEQKILIICMAIVVFLIILALCLLGTQRSDKITQSKEYKVDQELTSIRDVIEYLESTYYSEGKSDVNDYDLDIYVSFKCNLFDEEKSNEMYFTNLYEKIALVTDMKSFRLIDDAKDIVIEVKCNSTGISNVKINGIENYFKKEESHRSKENELIVDNIELEVNSSELQSLIDANWIAKNSNLGTVESRYNKYDIYFDEGYEIRSIKGKVYNIVFNENYDSKVVEGFKPDDNLERIEADLGTSYKDALILGYKTKDYYVYFSGNQISIYPRYKTDYTEFENLIKEYDKNKDINDFADKLTDIWPDYDQYTYADDYFKIDYTSKGVVVQYSSSNPEGIQIYENYTGELKQEKTDYKDVYYKLDQNLLIQKETERIMQISLYNNSDITEDPLHYSKRFFLNMTAVDDMFYNKIKILSLDDRFPNNEFDETLTIYTYIWADDSHLVYSIYGDGIYIYNAETRETEKILSDDEAFEITNYDRENNVIEYDGKQTEISF